MHSPHVDRVARSSIQVLWPCEITMESSQLQCLEPFPFKQRKQAGTIRCHHTCRTTCPEPLCWQASARGTISICWTPRSFSKLPGTYSLQRGLFYTGTTFHKMNERDCIVMTGGPQELSEDRRNSSGSEELVSTTVYVLLHLH